VSILEDTEAYWLGTQCKVVEKDLVRNHERMRNLLSLGAAHREDLPEVGRCAIRPLRRRHKERYVNCQGVRRGPSPTKDEPKALPIG
jgi:hypothetical protein